MGNPINVKPGDNYAYFTIIRELPKIHYGRRLFLCKCICGKEKAIELNQLRTGNTTSCGCMKGVKHGMSRTRIYAIWADMRIRCSETKKNAAWEKYGAKGIRVCEEWNNLENGFLNFYNWAIKNGYKEEKRPNGRAKYTIDRIDGTKGYSPDNCRWVDYETQNCNLALPSTNKSGYRGVSWSRKEKKWVCIISVNNRSVRIGAYETQKEAIEARNKYIDENNLPNQKNIYKGELSNGY